MNEKIELLLVNSGESTNSSILDPCSAGLFQPDF